MILKEAKRQYTNRFTMEHRPTWATQQAPSGMFYAPQYKTDEEWFENTIFPPRNPYHKTDCHSLNASWPMGKWLDSVYMG